jgi:hypothetical protein
LAVGSSALANSVTFFTAPGATESGGSPVDASGTFTTGADTLTIDLSNLLTASQMKNVAQNLSDVFFTLDTTSSSGSVSSSTATFVNIDGSGNATIASVPGTDPIGWALTNAGSDYLLNGLAGGAFTPAHTIIGGTPGDTVDPYSAANASIAGNGPHNPFVQGTGEFVLSIPGVTAGTNVSDVVFSFGTTAGDNVPGGVVPEPRFTSLLLFAGIMTAALVYRRRSRTT